MTTFAKEVEIEFDVTCSKCGCNLCTEEKEKRSYNNNSYELFVDICDDCKDELTGEIVDLKNEIKELEYSYEKRIEELEDKIEALKINNIYEILKKKGKKLINI